MAEMPLIPFAPAVASAIHTATGVWLTRLPMIPERVLAALHGSNEQAVKVQQGVTSQIDWIVSPILDRLLIYMSHP